MTAYSHIVMYAHIGSLFSSTAIFPLMLPKSFLDELKSCTKKFANYQVYNIFSFIASGS